MTGEKDLGRLLESMNPERCDTDYVFCSIKEPMENACQYKPWAVIREAEGITLIVTRKTAEKNGWPVTTVFNRITLNIHSSLDAVGLTAAVSARLAENRISANMIAGYYHDHIFVQKEKSLDAVRILNQLTETGAL